MDFKNNKIEKEINICFKELIKSLNKIKGKIIFNQEKAWVEAVPMFIEKLEYVLAIEEIIAIATSAKFQINISVAFWQKVFNVAKALELDKSLCEIEPYFA